MLISLCTGSTCPLIFIFNVTCVVIDTVFDSVSDLNVANKSNPLSLSTHPTIGDTWSQIDEHEAGGNQIIVYFAITDPVTAMSIIQIQTEL